MLKTSLVTAMSVALLIPLASAKATEAETDINYASPAGKGSDTCGITIYHSSNHGFLERVETQSGPLVIRQGHDSVSQSLWWHDQKLLWDSEVHFLKVYPEVNEKPSIIIVATRCYGSSCAYAQPYMVDTENSSLFVYVKPLPLSINKKAQIKLDKDAIKITKIDNDTYSFSGNVFSPPFGDGHHATYIYHRKIRMLERVQTK